MSQRILLLLIGLSLALGGFARAGDGDDERIDQTHFGKLFEHYQGYRNAPPPPVRHAADDIQYVFVSGFTGDYFYDYFRPQVAELERLGVPHERIRIIRPNSRRSYEENAADLYRKLQRIPGKLVIVAHSKGAAESVTVAMNHPDMARDRIEGIYCIQGAFGGSPIATALTRGAPFEFDLSHLTPTHRFFANTLRLIGSFTVLPLFRDGLKSLNRENSQKYFRDLMANNPEAVPIVSPKVHYIVTATKSSPISRLFEPHYGLNDGVLTMRDQSIPGFGNVIAEFTAEHEAYVSSANTRDVRAPHRFAIMRAIYAAVETRGSPPPRSGHCPWLALAKAETATGG